eukprot:scaffold265571_cov18-Tisochrysis_lutea.AAC.3
MPARMLTSCALPPPPERDALPPVFDAPADAAGLAPGLPLRMPHTPHSARLLAAGSLPATQHAHSG